MSSSVEIQRTESLPGELSSAPHLIPPNRILIATLISFFLIGGFALRANRLGAEGLSEDELNKLLAVQDYRIHGLSSTNGEHPLLMKAMMTASVVGAERWNSSVSTSPRLHVSTEAAVRFPSALFGTLITLLIFVLVAEMFGHRIALIAAALWAFDPTGIGLTRIGKEDTFLTFFFILANVFWLKGQRVAESGFGNPLGYYWATAASFGAMAASKYLLHPFAISVSYYHIFQGIPQTRWRLGKNKWLLFFTILIATFLICNPTILLPGTWQEMKIFAGEKRIGHDAYEFMGHLYRNQMTLWLKGSPWYFYFVFMAVKMAIPVVIAFLIGLPLLFRKRLGDGRFFVLFWLMYWFLPFTILGGKFTRYFTLALPVVLIVAAVGIDFVGRSLGSILGERQRRSRLMVPALAAVVVGFSIFISIGASPNFRLYTNFLGGGPARAGSFFPHDEFYDGAMREAAVDVAARARPGARVASETPGLSSFYAERASRRDLISVSLSDRKAVDALEIGDVIVVERGRRYFSNDAVLRSLRTSAVPVAQYSLGLVPSIEVFVIDESSLKAIAGSKP